MKYLLLAIFLAAIVHPLPARAVTDEITCRSAVDSDSFTTAIVYCTSAAQSQLAIAETFTGDEYWWAKVEGASLLYDAGLARLRTLYKDGRDVGMDQIRKARQIANDAAYSAHDPKLRQSAREQKALYTEVLASPPHPSDGGE